MQLWQGLHDEDGKASVRLCARLLARLQEARRVRQ